MERRDRKRLKTYTARDQQTWPGTGIAERQRQTGGDDGKSRGERGGNKEMEDDQFYISQRLNTIQLAINTKKNN